MVAVDLMMSDGSLPAIRGWKPLTVVILSILSAGNLLTYSSKVCSEI